jgi:hypothetical protein
VLLFLLFKQNKKINALKSEFSNANNSLTIVKDKLNREVATSKILQLEKNDMKKLAEIYKSKFDLEKMKPGKIKYIQSSSVQTIHDTTIVSTVSYLDSLPTYSIQDSSQWHYIKVLAKADSSKIFWLVNNQFITTHSNIAPFWKSPEYHIQTINLNPHTQTKEQLTYQIKPKKANRLIWFGCGLLISLIIKQ